MKILIFFFLIPHVFASVDENFLLNKVMSQNLSLQSFDQNVEGENVKRGFLKRSFIPTLTLELGQEKFQTGKYQNYTNPYGMLEARINLFRGGRDKIESSLRDLNARIADYNRSSNVREKILEARKLQWKIVFNNAMMKILEDESLQNKKIREQAQRRARSGVATSSDTLEFNIYQSELDETVESLQHENYILSQGLVPLLNLNPNEQLEFPDEIEHEHDESFMTLSFDAAKHPDVVSLEAQHESMDLQKRSSQLWWTPKLDLYGGYYLYTLRDRDYLAIRQRDDRVIGAKISFDLFDARSVNQATAASYQAEAKRLEARYKEKETQAKYIMLREDLSHTHELMHYVEDRITKSKDYLKVTLQEYDRGVKNSLDALTAVQRYHKYLKQYLEKKRDYQMIKADILALRGE